MKYKVGDKVRIKSLDWYNENKDENGNIRFRISQAVYPIFFSKIMSEFCGKIVTVKKINDGSYYMKETSNCEFWTDEMIEGLVEETKFEFKIGDKITNGKTQLTILTITSDKYIVEDNFGECGTLYFNTQGDWKLIEKENNDCEKCGLNRNSIRCLFMDNCPHNKQKNIIEIPDGYVVKDENDNVINIQKIVLEKKKKEYPKTYEECLKVLGIEGGRLMFNNSGITQYERDLYLKMNSLSKLLICRDAYWKIAGEMMGLGKPWKPDWKKQDKKYIISVFEDTVIYFENETYDRNTILAFPTEEMRDAFYENFKEEIEICKELL